MSTTHGVLVGGAYPNHYISLDGQDKEKVVTLLEEYRAGKHAAVLADEVKVCVLTYQCVARGMSPYLVLVGRPQTNNESTKFGFDGKCYGWHILYHANFSIQHKYTSFITHCSSVH